MDDYVAIVGQLGGRVFFKPAVPQPTIFFTDAQGRHSYEEREDKGRPGFKESSGIHQAVSRRAQRQAAGILNPAQAKPASLPCLKRVSLLRMKLDVTIHIHAGVISVSSTVLNTYRKPVVELSRRHGFKIPCSLPFVRAVILLDEFHCSL